MKQAFVTITNPGWLKFNRQEGNKTVVFWKRSASVSPFIKNGDLIFFLVRGHLPRYIRGYGVICDSGVDRLSEIWNKYGTKNGSETIEGAESRIGVTKDDYVGFYIVDDVVYLPPNKWATDEEIGFAKDIQIGKKYFNEKVDYILNLIDKTRDTVAVESEFINKDMKKYNRIKSKKRYIVFRGK